MGGPGRFRGALWRFFVNGSVHRPFEVEGILPPGQQDSERAALGGFHGQELLPVRFPTLIDLDDVGMAWLGRGLCLVAKPFGHPENRRCLLCSRLENSFVPEGAEAYDP